MSRSAAVYTGTVQDNPLDSSDFIVPTPPISAVSYSRLSVFEQCPYQAYLKFVKDVSEMEPPEGLETPLKRGSRVHGEAEGYVRGYHPLTPELESFKDEFLGLRNRFSGAPESILLEQMWAFDVDWVPTDSSWKNKDNIWLRVKQDVFVMPEPTEAVLIDHKTGKRKYNEGKHYDQLMISGLAAAFKYPEIQIFKFENWYLDLNLHFPLELTREDVLANFKEYDQRLRSVTECTNFTPRPSEKACQFCPYRSGDINKWQKGTGDCKYSAI